MSGKIELAKSSRATCRSCGNKIEKDTARFGEETVFRKGDEEFTSFKWHHLQCAFEKKSDILSDVDDYSFLEGEDLEKFQSLLEKTQFSNFGSKSLHDVTGEEEIVSIGTTVIRQFKPKMAENPNGEEQLVSIVYIGDQDIRSKLYLWKSNNLSLSKDDNLNLSNVKVLIGLDDKPEFHEIDETTILVNETTSSNLVKKYTSDAWKRPKSAYVTFERAKSSKASCQFCAEKIKQGELKLVKPEWGQNESNNRYYVLKVSFHLNCATKDELADELFHEGISRIDPETLREYKTEFSSLLSSIPGEGRNILRNIM